MAELYKRLIEKNEDETYAILNSIDEKSRVIEYKELLNYIKDELTKIKNNINAMKDEYGIKNANVTKLLTVTLFVQFYRYKVEYILETRKNNDKLNELNTLNELKALNELNETVTNIFNDIIRDISIKEHKSDNDINNQFVGGKSTKKRRHRRHKTIKKGGKSAKKRTTRHKRAHKRP
jgi:hypothetical protein